MSSETLPASLNPRDSARKVLTESVLQEALFKDVGPDAKFKSFQVEDFCSKGDNFACYVTSVVVLYAIGGQEKSVTYIAKLNQFGGVAEFEPFILKAFEKEGRFHCELVPALNEIRKSLKLPPLKIPKCFYASFERGQELLLLEDMRKKSFRMSDTKTLLDSDHTLLVIEELAHLHATSVVLEEKMGSEKFLETFNFFEDVFTSEAMVPTFKETLSGYINNGIQAAVRLGGNEKLKERLVHVGPRFHEYFDAALKTCNPKFRAVNHGDCWKNNMLFRYDGDEVADVCLFDLQVNRHASLANELNYFIFTSVNSDTRKHSLMKFLSAYYDSFKEVFDASETPMKFTLDELYKEYRVKNPFGVLMSFMGVAIFALKVEDIKDFTELNEDNISENVDENLRKLLVALDSNPPFQTHLTDLLEEIEEHGIFLNCSLNLCKKGAH